MYNFLHVIIITEEIQKQNTNVKGKKRLSLEGLFLVLLRSLISQTN